MNEVGTRLVISGWLVEICERCGGSGFSGYGTGYDDVCSTCGGTKYVPLEQVSHMKKSFTKIRCRDLMFRQIVNTYLATVVEHKGESIAVHGEYEGFTVRWRNKAELDGLRQWERVHCDGMSFITLPDKPTAMVVANELLVEMGKGACLPAAVKAVTRKWMVLTELGDWDGWRVEARDRWLRKYGTASDREGGKKRGGEDISGDDEEAGG